MTKLSKFAAIALVLLGILLAVVAMLSQRSGTAPEVLATVATPSASQEQVVVAKKDLPAGHVIAEDDLELQALAQMPALGIGNVQAVIGRSTAVEIAQGTPLQTSSLLDGLAGLLQSGERAVAIKVEEFSSVGHKVKPGDWVDVFAVLRKDATEVEDTQARLLLPRKRVLAFGAQLHPAAQSTQEKKDEDPQRRGTEVAARTAVIAVHVEEVNRLILAEQQGQVLLALRSPLDQVQPSAEIWQQTMGVVQAPEIAGAATGGASAMDASLTALTLSALTGVPEAKATATARSVASQPRVGAQRTQTRRNTVPVSGTSVEVVRGTRSETVRY